MFKELLSDAWPIIEEVAPKVASTLAGPYAEAATLVFGLLVKVFGCDKHDIPTLLKSISEDPESHSKLLEVQSSIPDNIKNIMPSSAEVTIKLNWD